MKGKEKPIVLERNRLIPAPTPAPMAIIGPSAPTGSPLPTANMHEINFTTIVTILKIFANVTPFKYPEKKKKNS